MLKVFYGDMQNCIYNTSVYFKNMYEEEWITEQTAVEMIKDVDKSIVLGNSVIDSPVLGKIAPTSLSGGVKTLILIKNMPEKIFNASTCGDNCAKWILKLAEEKDITINLRHLMDFGNERFNIEILNTGQIVHSMKELIPIAGDYVQGNCMKGKYRIIVQNKRIKYDFDIKRNITIIRGDSATGKTMLVDMIREYYENGEDSGIELNCEKTCAVLEGRNWKAQLSLFEDSIIFIDEGNSFVTSKDFAKEIQNSTNYYVIVTRESLSTLPYAVEEIYGIRDSGKYGGLKQTYNEMFYIYNVQTITSDIEPQVIITEDSNSGYHFFDYLCNRHKLKCISAEGKSNIFDTLKKVANQDVLIVADGAAFGPEMEKVMKFMQVKNNINLYLPESFEWLILCSEILTDQEIKKILKSPYEYIDGAEYMSLERYFTKLLIEKTKDTYLSYNKRILNPSYKQEYVVGKILKIMEKINFVWKDKVNE